MSFLKNAGKQTSQPNVSTHINHDNWIHCTTFFWDSKSFKSLYERSPVTFYPDFTMMNEFDFSIFAQKITVWFYLTTKKIWCFFLKITACGPETFQKQIIPHKILNDVSIPKDVYEAMTEFSTVEIKFMYKGFDMFLFKPLETNNTVQNSSAVENLDGSVTHAAAVNQLVEDLKCLYNKSDFTDVVLKVVTETSCRNIHAHRAILCGRSSVFSKMFEHETSEKANCVIEISDMEPTVFEKFIAFLYSCELNEENMDSLCDLYYAADKYEVVQLRALCGKAILSKLAIDNACRILALADRHNDENLKKTTIKFMSENLKELAKTSGWSEYMDMKLVTEIVTN